MKTLQKFDHIVYRFRCEHCRSMFEMTEDEKIENDWKFDDRPDKDKRRKEGRSPHNRMDYFDCPVCKCRRYVRQEELHKFSVMCDGTEINLY